ncbi:hypothetical protein POF51_07860 [Brevibacillus sp. AG]|uniref:hypothetical protein n=1 Tax=Brevibacillus sp. AG TaxID=3020891 RepID=UPI00232DA091|nr:hypothetical protein [Brevibacillus sp. AG]MDC0760601.1 hypothetical protein [Brevibacillus sp. AG]
MCLHGVYKMVNVINEQQNRVVKVDACIADEIQKLNDRGVVTLGCCCGHGKAGEIVEWENESGRWKGYGTPPSALIREASIALARELGYVPFPYYYADGTHNKIWQMQLKTGCLTTDEVKKWHEIMDVPLEKDIGIVK